MDRTTLTAVALILICAFVSLASSVYSPGVHSFQNWVNNKGDTGQFVNCGPKESQFVLDWTPRVLRPGVRLNLDISLKAIKSFDHGMVCVTAWLKGVPDPIYHDCSDQRCSDAQKVVKKFVPSFQCPIPEGFSVSFSKMPYTLQPSMPLPSGSFRVAANVTNQDNEFLFCAEGEIEVNDD